MKTVLSVLCLAGASFCTSGCGEPQRGFQDAFERAVQVAARTNGAIIQISSLTTFPWDKVFIFHPYMTPGAIDKALGIEWHSALKQELEYSDAFELLVFVRGDQVVKAAKVPRKVGDWALGDHNGLRPGEDVFVLECPPGSLETVMRLRRTK